MSNDFSLYVHPIPKKPSSLILYHHDTQVPSLRDVTNDCFLRSINQLDDPARVKVASLFELYLEKLHCEENLNFLIEIYRYEYYFDSIFPGATDRRRLNSSSMTSLPLNSSILTSPALNSPLNSPVSSSSVMKHSYDSYIAPFEKRESENLSRYLSKPSVRSVKSEDLDPQAVLVSTIDDLDPESSSKSAWDNLRLKNIDDNESLLLSLHSLKISPADQDLLTIQWDHIINTYIVREAPYQINLSEKLIKNIIKEHTLDTKTHCPSTLLKSRNEVLNLINENAYIGFVNKCKRELALASPPTASPSTASPSSLKEHSPKSYSEPKPIYGKDINNSAASPLLSPVTSSASISKLKNKFLKLSHTVNTLSPQNSTSPIPPTSNSASTHTLTLVSDDNSPSSSSSMSNVLGHLKLGRLSVNHTPTPSTLHSLASSPTSGSPGIKTPSSSSSLKFWSKKKNNV